MAIEVIVTCPKCKHQFKVPDYCEITRCMMCEEIIYLRDAPSHTTSNDETKEIIE